VVDVKPRHRADKLNNAFTFAWTLRAVESRGWQYEMWSELPRDRWRALQDTADM
jgi:hypothetical protein